MQSQGSSVDKIGRRLRSIRRRQRPKMTLAEFAKQVGVTASQISHYERGRDKIPIDRLEAMARVLDCEIAEFFRPSLPKREEDEC